MMAIKKHYPQWKEIKIHESSPNPSGASLALKRGCPGYVASQFFPGIPVGETVSDFINQDLERQSLADESFDLVITQDVFEHVFDPERAFKEICRTLRPGGAHIFTVPLINRHGKSEVWATKDAHGKTQFLKTPEIHGNPVDPNGSPVTMHWGFDIVDFIREKTGMETIIEDLYDLHFGLSAYYLEVLVSKKNFKMKKQESRPA
jgi:SAM-dependent methyltransferase